MRNCRLTLFTLLMIQLSITSGGKILVFPLDGSHWVNMKILIEELHAKGHDITVIRALDSWYIGEKSPLYTAVTIPGFSGFKDNFEGFLFKRMEMWHQSKPASLWSRLLNGFRKRQQVMELFTHFHKSVSEMMVLMFEDKSLMHSLEDAKFDLVLTDPVIGGGAMLAQWLKVPLVFNVRWTITGEGHMVIAPSPLSYVPYMDTKLTDKMTFLQRVKNWFRYVLAKCMTSSISEPSYEPVVRRFFGSDVDYSTFFSDADIWLMRNDFVFEFPRPTMPNVVYMSGFQCKPSKPLPPDLEDFVQSSGDHGVIIMTLGTLVGNLPMKIAEEIAASFSQLPQKVIWRYKGQKPTNLGNNTLLVDWLPQNNLLGHPKTKVFVTHGGTNGVQESIYHGVPLVGLPLFFDQPENIFRITSKGAAETVDLVTLDRHVFGEALKKVLYIPSYRECMQRLSALHKDQPIKPLDKAVFWIEYVIRHKGARHLKSESHKMSGLLYHSVDVIAALLTVGLIVLFFFVSLLRRLFRMIFNKTKVKCS